MSKSAQQSDLSTFTAGTDTVDITRTVRCRLETSERKNQLVQKGIDAYQQVAARMAAVLPSYPEHEWEPRHSHMYHHAKRFLPDDGVNYKTTLAAMAQQQVTESFKSWRENGKQGDPPLGEFGDAPYLGLRTDDVTIVENERGWGLKTNFISYKPVWFHIDAGDFQREFLSRITDPTDDARAGSAELHLHDGGELYCHLTVSWPVEVYQAAEVETVVGVDLNDDPLAVAAVVSPDGVADVEFVSGSEFRHHRERVKRRRAKAMEEENFKAVKSARLTYEKYTDHITNVASRRVVDLADEHRPAKIHIEDLSHYRETAKDPIHDWPFAMIQEQICAKATEAGLPVEKVDPRNTSVTCRKCGTTNPAMRDGDEFGCWDCGYEVHADVNAAINIANI